MDASPVRGTMTPEPTATPICVSGLLGLVWGVGVSVVWVAAATPNEVCILEARTGSGPSRLRCHYRSLDMIFSRRLPRCKCSQPTVDSPDTVPALDLAANAGVERYADIRIYSNGQQQMLRDMDDLGHRMMYNLLSGSIWGIAKASHARSRLLAPRASSSDPLDSKKWPE